MGVYSNLAKKNYLESNLLYEKAVDDYYKTGMFYGLAQVVVDAHDENEAKYFAARAVNDFDTFKKCYKPKTDNKINGIVVNPSLTNEAANEFVVVYKTENGKMFEKVVIENGKILSCNTTTVVKEENNTEAPADNNNTPAPSTPEPSNNDTAEVDNSNDTSSTNTDSSKEEQLAAQEKLKAANNVSESSVVTEDVKEVFKSIKDAIIKALNSIIDFLDGLLQKIQDKKNSTIIGYDKENSIAGKIRALLKRAKDAINKTKSASTKEDINEAKEETDNIKNETEDINKQFKKATGMSDEEFEKFEKDTEDITEKLKEKWKQYRQSKEDEKDNIVADVEYKEVEEAVSDTARRAIEKAGGKVNDDDSVTYKDKTYKHGKDKEISFDDLMKESARDF